MAQLRLAVCSHMDPVVSSPNLPVTSQYIGHSEAFEEQLRLEHPKTNIQQQPPNKDKQPEEVCIQKGQGSFCSQSTESSQLISENAGFWSAGHHNRYLKNQVSIPLFHWRAKRREGVDRAYPLKPVIHQKAGNGSIPSNWQVGSPPTTETPSSNINSETPSPNSSSENKGRSHAAKAQHVGVPSPSAEQSKRAASHPRRAEPGYIKKMEAACRNLEEAIQRKEALLREKLKSTEKVLQRIQWEKQQAQAKPKNQQRLCLPERKAADISRGHHSRATVQPHDGQSLVVSVETTQVPSELHMERLKKQQLVANNSKIRENVSQKNAMTPCPELDSRHDQPPTVDVLRQTVCMATPYMEAPSNVEDLGECSFCGRKFYCFRLEKHISICSKNHGSNRKVFNSRKARAKDTELEVYNLLMDSGTSKKQTSTKSTDTSMQSSSQPKQSNWKQKHESFIQTLRRAREIQRIISKGGKASDLPPVPPMENPDYKMCPYCTRRFAPKVAERHIPKCKNIKSRPPPPQQKVHC